MISRFIKLCLPKGFRQFIRKEIAKIVLESKAPRMIYGFRDSTGEWRPNTRVGDTVFFNNPENIKISDNVFVGHFSVLDGTKSVEIGEGTQIGSWVGIFTHSSHYAIRLYGKHYLEVPESEKLCYEAAPIKIGRYVFIGSGAQILPGVEIGDGAIIAGGARIKKSVKPFSLVDINSKVFPDAAKKLDTFNLNRIKNEQLRVWHNEWQIPTE